MGPLILATRESQLALAQSEQVKTLLQSAYPDIPVHLLGLTTEGDKHLNVYLQKLGGKGLFVKELENCLLRDEAQLAVHSAKDVPMELPEGLILSTFLARANPADAMVSNQYIHFKDLPEGAIIGTSSLRRICQLKAAHPHLHFKLLRGNVLTRLQKLDAGEFDAIILAVAGLERLHLTSSITEILPFSLSLPACGQGAIAIEIREDNHGLAALLAPFDCAQTRACVLAERAMTRKLGGSCSVPIAAYATWEKGQLWLRGLVGAPDGSVLLHGESYAQASDYERLGEEVATQLLAQGAEKIIHDARQI